MNTEKLNSERVSVSSTGLVRRLCAPRVEIHLPNPLWWIVGYGAVYPWRKIKRALAKPIPPKKNYCGGCGKDEGDSVWGFCSPECLEKICAKESPPNAEPSRGRKVTPNNSIKWETKSKRKT